MTDQRDALAAHIAAKGPFVTDAPWQTGVPDWPDETDEYGNATTGPCLAILADGTTQLLEYVWEGSGSEWLDWGWYDASGDPASNYAHTRIVYWVPLASITEDLPAPFNTPEI